MLSTCLTEPPSSQVSNILSIIQQLNPNFDLDELDRQVWATARKCDEMPSFRNLYTKTIFQIAKVLILDVFPMLDEEAVGYNIDFEDSVFWVNGCHISSLQDIDILPPPNLAVIAGESLRPITT